MTSFTLNIIKPLFQNVGLRLRTSSLSSWKARPSAAIWFCCKMRLKTYHTRFNIHQAYLNSPTEWYSLFWYKTQPCNGISIYDISVRAPQCYKRSPFTSRLPSTSKQLLPVWQLTQSVTFMARKQETGLIEVSTFAMGSLCYFPLGTTYLFICWKPSEYKVRICFSVAWV